eukprot:COSAG04_NODE_2936_length_3371_cov_1.523533_2_plen_987_part_01
MHVPDYCREVTSYGRTTVECESAHVECLSGDQAVLTEEECSVAALRIGWEARMDRNGRMIPLVAIGSKPSGCYTDTFCNELWPGAGIDCAIGFNVDLSVGTSSTVALPENAVPICRCANNPCGPPPPPPPSRVRTEAHTPSSRAPASGDASQCPPGTELSTVLAVTYRAGEALNPTPGFHGTTACQEGDEPVLTLEECEAAAASLNKEFRPHDPIPEQGPGMWTDGTGGDTPSGCFTNTNQQGAVGSGFGVDANLGLGRNANHGAGFVGFNADMTVGTAIRLVDTTAGVGSGGMPICRSDENEIPGCAPCAAGTVDHDADANTPCLPCPEGRFGSRPLQYTCDGVCPAGTSSVSGSLAIDDCRNCSPGRFAPTPGSRCLSCPMGRFAAGHFFYDTGPPKTECTACTMSVDRSDSNGAGSMTWTAGPGATSQDECQPGSCSDTAASNHRPVPDGSQTTEACLYDCGTLAGHVGVECPGGDCCLIYEADAWPSLDMRGRTTLSGVTMESAEGSRGNWLVVDGTASLVVQGRLTRGPESSARTVGPDATARVTVYTSLSALCAGKCAPTDSVCTSECMSPGGANGPDGWCTVDSANTWNSCAPQAAAEPVDTAAETTYTTYFDSFCAGRDEICNPDQEPCSFAFGDTAACIDACSADASCASAMIEPDGSCHLSATCVPWVGDDPGTWGVGFDETWTFRSRESLGWTTLVKSAGGLSDLVLHQESLSWTDAEAACVAEGGHLVSIHSDEQQAALESLFPDGTHARSGAPPVRAWLGLNDREIEAGCEMSSDPSQRFVWTDGSPNDYTHWMDGEPNDWDQPGGVATGAAHCDGTGNEDCAQLEMHALDRTGWRDADCESEYPFVCSKRANQEGEGWPGILDDSYLGCFATTGQTLDVAGIVRHAGGSSCDDAFETHACDFERFTKMPSPSYGACAALCAEFSFMSLAGADVCLCGNTYSHDDRVPDASCGVRGIDCGSGSGDKCHHLAAVY